MSKTTVLADWLYRRHTWLHAGHKTKIEMEI